MNAYFGNIQQTAKSFINYEFVFIVSIMLCVCMCVSMDEVSNDDDQNDRQIHI